MLDLFRLGAVIVGAGRAIRGPLGSFRCLVVCYDRSFDIHRAFFHPACALIA
jgi:hypothetical protein